MSSASQATGSISAVPTTICKPSMNSSSGRIACCPMAETILVTGASGFIGTRLVAALREQGHDVRTHSSRDGDIAGGFAPPDEASAVVHLAARSFVPESWEQSADYYCVNVLGAVRVLEFCRRRQA